jgi:cytochrome c-type biogenesis protein
MDVQHLVQHSPWGFVIAFGGGMLSFLSPCVLPLVPGYVSLMSGLSSAQLADGPEGSARVDVLRSTLLFVLGFTVVFTAFFAGAFGVVQAYLLHHQDALNRAAGIVIIVMGLLLAGLVSPRLLMQERRMHVSPSRLGVWAAPVMGMAFAFGWTPCIGAVLGPVLLVAAAQNTLTRGLFLLIAYSLGLGVPFVAAGLALGRLTGVFGWVKRHFRVLNLVSGLFLVAFGVVLLTHHLTQWSTNLIDFMNHVPGLRRLSKS